MKSLNLIFGALVLAAALTACGKKGGSSSAPAGANVATNPAMSAGYVGVNTYRGNLIVTDMPHYLVFLQDQGLCYGAQCSLSSGYFGLQVQTLTEMLPDDVNFYLTPRFSGYPSRSLRTRGEGYMTADGRGFQVQYKRFGYTGGFPTPYGGIGVGGTQPYAMTSAKTLYITLTFADATNAIANVTVQYEGFTIASGQMRGAVATAVRTPGQGGPAVMPYR